MKINNNEFFDALRAAIPSGKLSPDQVDALVAYVSDVANSEDDAVRRLSSILERDVAGISLWKNIIYVEMLKEKNSELVERVKNLEQKIDNINNSLRKIEVDQVDGGMRYVKPIFIALSFIASVVAFLKAFNVLSLPW